jgi:hypothetical protein
MATLGPFAHPPFTFISPAAKPLHGMRQMSSAKWKKLRSGDWAVENVGTPARVGDVIAITRRAGGIDRVVVRQVMWEGDGKQWLKATRPTAAEGTGGTIRRRPVVQH